MTVIIISGTPGTGKTELAKELAKQLKYKYIDINKVVDKNKLIESYDEEKDTNVVNEKKLVKALVKIIKEKKDLVIDSHLSHYIPSKHVDLCIITKCNLKTLKKRLEKKGYKSKKVRENLDAEIFDICLNEAMELKHKLLIMDTSKQNSKTLAKKIIYF
ncbi:MAG: adenylate kinase family protein [Nanoarchaeota archaeon]|nr:adenylate kinase family protein [Nanoarchaeota archaeon]MBU4351467.1 adenylate kinase family protein [Nanoarchaeota archaeon]MBU4456397.1 adenylate kinase family protein [Nanoarchaeota archaeon]